MDRQEEKLGLVRIKISKYQERLYNYENSIISL